MDSLINSFLKYLSKTFGWWLALILIVSCWDTIGWWFAFMFIGLWFAGKLFPEKKTKHRGDSYPYEK